MIQPASSTNSTSHVYRPNVSLLTPVFYYKVSAALAAQAKGLKDQTYYWAHCAESELLHAIPAHIRLAVRAVAARKDSSAMIAKWIVRYLDAQQAAAIIAVWFVRNAAMSGIRSLYILSADMNGFFPELRRALGSDQEVSRFRSAIAG